MGVRITSWNLQGREGLDVDRVASILVGLESDVVALQEVQRGQAAALAARLGWEHRWWFKHWTVVYPAEGLAILTPRALGESRRIHLAHRWRFWSWRRRVAVMGTVDGIQIVDVHLGSGVGDIERSRQSALVVSAMDDTRPSIVAGDFNTKPGSEVMGIFEAAGFVDSWTTRHPDVKYATNWKKGPRSGPPTQRLDYVLVRGLDATDAVVGDSADPDWGQLAPVSDHVPITVTLATADPA